MSTTILKIQDDVLDFAHLKRVFETFEKKHECKDLQKHIFEAVEEEGFDEEFHFEPNEKMLCVEISKTEEKLKALEVEQFLTTGEKKEIEKMQNYLTCLETCYNELYRCKMQNATFEHAKELFNQIMEIIGEIADLYNSEENKSSYNCAGLGLIRSWKLINKLASIIELAMAERAMAFLRKYDTTMCDKNIIIGMARLLTGDRANAQCLGLDSRVNKYIKLVAPMINRAHFVVAGLSNTIKKFLDKHHSDEFVKDQIDTYITSL